MAATETVSFSVASVVEDVLQQHGNRQRGLDLESRRAEEAGILFFLQIFFYVCSSFFIFDLNLGFG